MTAYKPIAPVVTAGKSNIGALFHGRVVAHPSNLAVVDGARTLTYQELEERSNRLAQAMLGMGLVSGERVALLAKNCAEYVEIELAAAKTGIIIAALNWRLAERELTHCIRLVEPRLIILQAEFVSVLEGLDLPTQQRLTIGADYEDALGKSPATYPDCPIDPEDGLIILYTSGTTGLPKGALISHRAMIARAMCFASEMQIPIGDNFIAWPPFYHMASTDQSLATLLRGGTVYIVEGYLPDRIVAILETVKCRFLILMPGMVGHFVDYLETSGAQPKGVDMLGAMADLVPREDIAAVTRFFNAPYLNTFGATETGLPPATGGLLPVGIPPESLSKRQSAFCELRLVDPDGRDVPIGVPGEVAVKGPTVFSGYWQADEVNTEDFRGGWFHMGDVMRRNADGSLDYVDRVKYMIKSGGENIYPAEIEQVLKADSRVEEAVVVKRADTRWGEVPVVFIVRQDPTLSEAQVETICRSDLSSYKRPKAVFFVHDTDLPRSTTGKIQRHELERRLRSGEAKQTTPF
jgi:acyl-CoA synthetase (AMP-forming)/AMP-acid ligase II